MSIAERPMTKPDQAIVHPLDQLRGTIHRFVILDGLLAAGLFAVVVFWLGLGLDYGLFRLTSFDWVIDAPWTLRAIALGTTAIIMIVILVRRIVGRLTREYSYPGLAMVLEKRYPALLGGRLITAVELADSTRSAEVGYSADMIRHTVDEARDNVAKVPIHEVFNWRRLWLRFFTIIGIMVGMMLAWFAVHAATVKTNFLNSFSDVVTIYAERDLLLQQTPWPRKAYVEVIAFPDAGLRVGKDDAAPTIRVRAYRWVVADDDNRFGWRPMRWSDIDEGWIESSTPTEYVIQTQTGWTPTQIGMASALGTLSLTQAEQPVSINRVDVSDMTIDDVQATLTVPDPDAASQVRTQFPAINELFVKLEELANDPRMSRTMRKLDVPATVTMEYRGLADETKRGGQGGSTRGEIQLTPEKNGFYSTTVKDLKESVNFRVRAEDFLTDPRTITLVPPPMLTKLSVRERQPAYLYYAPPIDPTTKQPNYQLLTGLRQRVGEKELSLTGERSVRSIPVGTELTLTGIADKPLSKVMLVPVAGPLPGSNDGSPVMIEPQGERFSVQFDGDDRIREPIEFRIEMTDEDGVTSTRDVLLQADADEPPRVDIAVDIIRKKNNVYLCTPVAQIPFVTDSSVSDDTGLSSVRFRFTSSRLEARGVIDLQVGVVPSLFVTLPMIPSIASAIGPAFTGEMVKTLSSGEGPQTAGYELPAFRSEQDDLRSQTVQTLKQQYLDNPENIPTTDQKVLTVNLDVSNFDLAEADKALIELAETEGRTPRLMLVEDAAAYQPRYRVEVDLVAQDVNVETGPKESRNLEPIVLQVISEADLLDEITKDEETLIARLDDALLRLRVADDKLNQQIDLLNSMGDNPDVLLSARVRAEDILQDIGKASAFTQSVVTGYTRLRREVEANRVGMEFDIDILRDVSKVARRYDATIIQPLNGLLDNEFSQTTTAMEDFRMPLLDEPAIKPDETLSSNASVQIKDLIQKLSAIREQLGKELSLNKLRDDLNRIILEQKQVSAAIERIKTIETQRLFLPEISAVEPITMKPNETTKISHDIDWKIYDKSSLKIRFEIPKESGLSGPGELTISDENVDFSYELKSSDKTGEFTIELIPEVGPRRSIKVMVK